MEVLNIFSAGAAQALVTQVARQFPANETQRINARYGAVKSVQTQVRAGEPADVVILTDTLIDEMIAEGLLVPGSRVDLGTVETGIAVRAGIVPPEVSDTAMLRTALLEAGLIICPDPAVATAGRVLLGVLNRLGIRQAVAPRLQYCVSGYEAMQHLARTIGPRDLGVMQVTEIIAQESILLAGSLPEAMQEIVVYSAALSTNSANPERSLAFIRDLTGDSLQLRMAGFGTSPAKLPQQNAP